MKTTWKIWNYQGRRLALARFILFCLAAVAFAVIFLMRPESPSLSILFLFPLLMILGGGVIACFFGYRAFFFSDDWFRAKDARQADWWDNHPRFNLFASVTVWSCWTIVIVYQIWRIFHKH
jgi:hypothetical protein